MIYNYLDALYIHMSLFKLQKKNSKVKSQVFRLFYCDYMSVNYFTPSYHLSRYLKHVISSFYD